MAQQFRPVQLILMKRKHIALTRDDRYGHWWFEIGDSSDPASESYGWWPSRPVGLKDTMQGIEGDLNGSFWGGTPTRDVHHGDSPDEQFHPVVSASDTRTDEEIADCLRAFAQSYQGEWRWTFGKGQNCHTFQTAAMEHCGIRKPSIKHGA